MSISWKLAFEIQRRRRASVRVASDEKRDGIERMHAFRHERFDRSRRRRGVDAAADADEHLSNPFLRT